MGTPLLKEVLQNWQKYEPDDDIYVPSGTSVTLETAITIFPFDRHRPRRFEGIEYILSFEQVRDAIVGLETQLRREASAEERLAAVLHYARHDAFIDPQHVPMGRLRE
ncbi:hypothetical protein WME75_35645 [Sorangium sp. So ce1014]|uniref:DUF7716 domain-containing protein n=1 Tax=Sorangium sp. So ce1014 TaxID=3133326 RepID=UPI003F60D915